MAVANKVGYFKPYTPNAKADQKSHKPFGIQKKCDKWRKPERTLLKESGVR